jgi:hypothetical protein
VQGGVASEILKLVFGTDDVAFTACSTTLPAGSTCGEANEVLRSYTSFLRAGVENALSRIYVGIHFRKAVEDGLQHGQRIATYAVAQYLKPTQ